MHMALGIENDTRRILLIFTTRSQSLLRLTATSLSYPSAAFRKSEQE